MLNPSLLSNSIITHHTSPRKKNPKSLAVTPNLPSAHPLVTTDETSSFKTQLQWAFPQNLSLNTRQNCSLF